MDDTFPDGTHTCIKCHVTTDVASISKEQIIQYVYIHLFIQYLHKLFIHYVFCVQSSLFTIVLSSVSILTYLVIIFFVSLHSHVHYHRSHLLHHKSLPYAPPSRSSSSLSCVVRLEVWKTRENSYSYSQITIANRKR